MESMPESDAAASSRNKASDSGATNPTIMPAHAEAAHQLEALMECIPDFIYFKDTRSRFVRCSRALLLRFHASSNADVLGKSDFDFIAREDAQAAFDEEMEIIRTGRPVIGRIHTRTFSNEGLLWRLTSKMPWRDHSGKIIGTLGVTKDITNIKRAELELERMHRHLIDVSRQAGMAEVAESVLHGVGNTLNSVNVAAALALDHVKNLKVSGLVKLEALLREHEADLGDFLSNDPRGKQVPAYLTTLVHALTAEQRNAIDELHQLQQHVAHISEILALQQRYAHVKGIPERVAISDIIEDALRVHAATLSAAKITVIRDFLANPVSTLERHKVLHIFVNILDYARTAYERSGHPNREVTIRLTQDAGCGRVEINHHGLGFAPDMAVHIFAQNSIEAEKHAPSIDLHHTAILAKELGGSLTARSDGPDHGATFTLGLPVEEPGVKR
jgi:PAS domain S-box-containing protein